MVEVNRWINELGVRVIVADLGELNGVYLHDHHTILLDNELAPIQRRSTLMHELGHAYYRHPQSSARTEREASEWAARALIRPCELLKLSRIYDDLESVAHELGVLPRDVKHFHGWATRIRQNWPKTLPPNGADSTN